MAKKGYIIDIGGNTSPLQKSLDDVNKVSRSLEGELKQVERLLKFDPENTVLLAQKQELLGKSVMREAADASQIYETVHLRTAPMPHHGIGDVLYVQSGTAEGKFLECGWSMELEPNGEMTHELQKVVRL